MKHILFIVAFVLCAHRAMATDIGYTTTPPSANELGRYNDEYNGIKAAGVSGTVTYGYAYMSCDASGPNYAKMQVYRVSDGALIAVSNQVTLSTTKEWVQFTFTTFATSAVDYAILVDNYVTAHNHVYYDSSPGAAYYSGTNSYASPSNPITLTPIGDYQYGIYLALDALPALNIPTLSTPSDTATGQATSVSLGIGDTNSSPNETGIIFRIKASGGSYSYSSQQAADTTSLSAATALGAGLANGTQYYWSAKAVGDGSTTGDSAYPTDFSFTTEAGVGRHDLMILGVGN